MRTLAAALTLSIGSAALAAPPPLIPRELLLGNPERAQARIAPDGKHIAWLQPDAKDVLQVWVRTVGASDDKAVTADKKRGIRAWHWAQGGRMVLYQQDADGDENFHLYGVDLASGAVRDFTPWQGARANVVDISSRFPDTILVGVNVRDPKVFDVYRIDLRTGAALLDTKNPGDVAGWVVDAKMVVRGAGVVTPDGGTELRVRDSAKAPWRTLLKAPAEEALDLVGFDPAGGQAWLETSLGADTQRLVARDLRTGKERELARDEQSDAAEVMVNPTTEKLEAVSFYRDRRMWKVLDPKYAGDFEALAKLAPGDVTLVTQDDADKTWLVGMNSADAPTKYYLWDRAARKGTYLFSDRPKLEGAQLAKVEPVSFPARDGVTLHGYLTRPVGASGAGPLVLWVHGGPWARDRFFLSGFVQLFANRGYSVLQVNYRGSDGYGKKFLHLGDKQWGRAMHTDLLDGVAWAVKQGIADPKRVAIAGGSYGGYAALAGAAFAPDTFRCAIDIVGPSNLATLLHSIPPYWAPMRALFTSRMGDPDDKAQEARVRADSPLFSADKIRIPMLIGQGANDPRVKQAESEQIVAAIARHGGRATYVLYSDEGHGFARPPNNLDFAARMEAFLAAHLGGRAQPLGAERYPGSTAAVREVGGPQGKTAAR